ncbi:YfdX family protein, partial [Escherichia coli]
VRSAQSLMAEGKYYEANLALKGAEDGTIMDTISLH